MLVFQPGFSSEDVFEKKLRPWIELLHAHSPGAHMVLVCTRWLTKEEGEDVTQYQQRISKLSKEVGGYCRELVEELNSATQEEASRVQERMQKLIKGIADNNVKLRISVLTVQSRHGQRLESQVRKEIKRDEESLQATQCRLDVLCVVPPGYRRRDTHMELVAKKMTI